MRLPPAEASLDGVDPHSRVDDHDDEFGYAFEGGVRDAAYGRREYRATPMPGHLVTDVKGAHLGALHEESEHEATSGDASTEVSHRATETERPLHPGAQPVAAQQHSPADRAVLQFVESMTQQVRRRDDAEPRAFTRWDEEQEAVPEGLAHLSPAARMQASTGLLGLGPLSGALTGASAVTTGRTITTGSTLPRAVPGQVVTTGHPSGTLSSSALVAVVPMSQLAQDAGNANAGRFDRSEPREQLPSDAAREDELVRPRSRRPMAAFTSDPADLLADINFVDAAAADASVAPWKAQRPFPEADGAAASTLVHTGASTDNATSRPSQTLPPAATGTSERPQLAYAVPSRFGMLPFGHDAGAGAHPATEPRDPRLLDPVTGAGDAVRASPYTVSGSERQPCSLQPAVDGAMPMSRREASGLGDFELSALADIGLHHVDARPVPAPVLLPSTSDEVAVAVQRPPLLTSRLQNDSQGSQTDTLPFADAFFRDPVQQAAALARTVTADRTADEDEEASRQQSLLRVQAWLAQAEDPHGTLPRRPESEADWDARRAAAGAELTAGTREFPAAAMSYRVSGMLRDASGALQDSCRLEEPSGAGARRDAVAADFPRAMSPAVASQRAHFAQPGDIVHHFMEYEVDASAVVPHAPMQLGLCQSLFHGFSHPRPLPKSLEAQRLRLLALAKKAFSNTDHMHELLLSTVFRSYVGKVPERYGKHWELLGFQGQDPALDLRGGGLLGLINLLQLFLHSKRNAEALFALSRSPDREFPLALVGINITTWAVELARAGHFNSAAVRRSSVVQTVVEFYVGAFYTFYLRWSRKKTRTAAEGGEVLAKLKAYAKRNVAGMCAQAAGTLPR